MDSPWKLLANTLAQSARVHVHLQHDVQSVCMAPDGRVSVTGVTKAKTFHIVLDGLVLALPAPAIMHLLSSSEVLLKMAPSHLNRVKYAPHLRVYASRKSTEDRNVGLHLVPPQETVGTIEFFNGRHGSWGACPETREWGLVCAHVQASEELMLNASTASRIQGFPADDTLTGPEFAQQMKGLTSVQRLWGDARRILPDLFDINAPDVDVVLLHQWKWAVPVFVPGHYTHMAAYRRVPPVVFAGDWTQEACVEGAVRSGELAAAAWPAAGHGGVTQQRLPVKLRSKL